MRRRAAVLGIVVALALAASACGSGSDAAVSIKTLQAAVSNTQDAASSRFVIDLSFGGGSESAIHVSGVASGDGKTMQLTASLPPTGSIEERLVDGTLYINVADLGALSDRLPAGMHWLSLTGAQVAGSGADLGPLFDHSQSSPAQGLEYLESLSGDVQNLGDDRVAGEHATHYRASLDYAKEAAKLPASSSDLAAKLAKLGTVPADLWIDDHGHVVKMRFAIDGSAFGAGAGRAEITMEITDFGVPVDVQAPPADETFDFSSLGAQQA